MKVVTAARRPDGTAASRIHRARRPQVMAGSGPAGSVAGSTAGPTTGAGAGSSVAAGTSARPDRPRTEIAAAATSATHSSANPTAHAARWSPSPNRGPMRNG